MGCGGQSLSAQYGGASLIGPSRLISTVDAVTPTLVALVPIPAGGGGAPFVPAVFVITFLVSTSRIKLRQGGATVVANTGDFTIDSTIAIGTFWRIDVNDPTQAFLSILTPDAALTNTIVITRIDSVDAVGSP